MEVLVSGNPRDAKKASITGSGRLHEFKNRFAESTLLRTVCCVWGERGGGGEESPYTVSKFNPPNADTPFIRTLSMAPSVSVGVEKDWDL